MRKGFTLIEILIVVAIIAILASVVVVGLGPTQQAGRDARRLADLRETQNALAVFYAKCGYYPGTIASGACSAAVPSTAAAFPSTAGSSIYGAVATNLVGAGIGVNTMPQDPTAGATYRYTTNAASSPSQYVVGATLESGNNAAFTNYNPPSSISGGGDAFACTVASRQYCLTI